MVMVPVLVVMSGALAFSAFSGSITTNVSASAGYISFNQQALLYNYSASNTVMTVDSTSLAAPTPSTFEPTSLGWAGLDSHIANSTKQTVTIGNMAPGNYVTFEFKVTNNGSVGFILSSAKTSGSASPGPLQTGETLETHSTTTWTEFAQDMSLSTEAGYIYLVSSIPSGSIDSGSYATYFVTVGLASSSANLYQESTFALSITVTVTSDA